MRAGLGGEGGDDGCQDHHKDGRWGFKQRLRRLVDDPDVSDAWRWGRQWLVVRARAIRLIRTPQARVHSLFLTGMTAADC